MPTHAHLTVSALFTGAQSRSQPPAKRKRLCYFCRGDKCSASNQGLGGDTSVHVRPCGRGCERSAIWLVHYRSLRVLHRHLRVILARLILEGRGPGRQRGRLQVGGGAAAQSGQHVRVHELRGGQRPRERSDDTPERRVQLPHVGRVVERQCWLRPAPLLLHRG